MQRLAAILGWLAIVVMASPQHLRGQATELYTFTANRSLPDGNAAGLSDVRHLNSHINRISSISVSMTISGEFNGDLFAYLRHAGHFVVLLNRPGKTTATPAGYADSGLNVTLTAAATNGDIHLYHDFETPTPETPLTGIWQPDGRAPDPAMVTDIAPRLTALTNFNALDGSGDWTLYLADMDSGGTNYLGQWTLAITGFELPALNWAHPVDIVYGTPLDSSQLNATATHYFTNVPGSFTYTPPAGTVLAAGFGHPLSVTFTPDDTNVFLPVTTNIMINVLRAPLTITANDTNKLYGRPVPALSATYNGFVNGDSPSILTTSVTLQTTAVESSPLGDYPIFAGGATASNYDITHINGTLTVYTTNHPPILAHIPDVVISPDEILYVRLDASDVDGDDLTFALDPGAPVDAFTMTREIPRTNTFVLWRPTRANASTTNIFTVRVSDNGAPSFNAFQTFTVRVQDYLDLSIASTNLQVLQTVTVPIQLSSDGGVTDLQFTLGWRPEYLTNAQLTSLAPQIAGASLQNHLTNLSISLQTAPGQPLQGTQVVAQLTFTASSDQHSAFLYLPIGPITALKPDGSPYENYIAPPPQTIVVQDVPLLVAALTTNSTRNLYSYGRLGTIYELQYTTNLNPFFFWSPYLTFTQTFGRMIIPVNSTNSSAYYRLFEP